jgi:hypothetical protein
VPKGTESHGVPIQETLRCKFLVIVLAVRPRCYVLAHIAQKRLFDRSICTNTSVCTIKG